MFTVMLSKTKHLSFNEMLHFVQHDKTLSLKHKVTVGNHPNIIPIKCHIKPCLVGMDMGEVRTRIIREAQLAFFGESTVRIQPCELQPCQYEQVNPMFKVGDNVDTISIICNTFSN
jgi:hypothetical protein